MSSHDGAAARDIAGLVARTLDFRLIDEDIVATAALEAGVDEGVVEDVERRKSLLGRLLGGITAGPAPADALESALYGGTGTDELKALIRWAIEEVADAGDAVLVAHAASFALARRDDVLRVLVTASPSVRRQRLAAELGIDGKEATRRIKRSDAGRADYIKRFYGIDGELPTHYDLVINTDKLSPGVAGLLVAGAVRTGARPSGTWPGPSS